MELIQRSGDEAFFRRQILDAFVSSQDTYDLNQLFELIGILAACGDAEARQAMYDRFGALTTENDIHFYTDKMLDADGETAFRFLLDRYGAISKAEPDYWFDDALLVEARERLGEDTVQRIVAEASESSSDVRAYIDAAREYRERIQRRSSAGDRFMSMTYAQLLDVMSSPSQRKPLGPGFFFRWGARASDDDITRVANDVLICDDKDQHLLWRLQVFVQRPFPLAPDRLISFAQAADWTGVNYVPAASRSVKISHYALLGLKGISHPLVREHGLRLLNDPHLKHYALDMFVNNFEVGDSDMFNEFIARELTDDELHSASMSVQALFEQTPSSELATTFVLLYDRNPCSHCRTAIVEALIELGALPEWMARECSHDSVPETREIARSYRDCKGRPTFAHN
jgi:hypothetical protein